MQPSSKWLVALAWLPACGSASSGPQAPVEPADATATDGATIEAGDRATPSVDGGAVDAAPLQAEAATDGAAEAAADGATDGPACGAGDLSCGCANACASSLCTAVDGGFACGAAIAVAAAGAETAFAVLADGTIRAWGNGGSLLGTGDSMAPSTGTPRPVTGITTAQGIAAGQASACALLSGGTVACWGDNSYGQLGTDPTVTASSATPIAVTGLSDAIAIAAGAVHACALISGGTVECWGSNDFGELGNTLTTSCNGGTDKCSAAPVPVTGLTGVTALAIGGYDEYEDHTCALLSNGTVQCWGDDGYGQLGNGSTPTSSPDSKPVTVSTITNGIAIASASDTSCAILSGGAVMCWGSNASGALGGGTATDSTTPVTVQNVTDAVSLSVGPLSNTFCAIRANGTAVCWGQGYSGEVGTGDSGASGPLSSPPVALGGVTGVSAIAFGPVFACGLLMNGSVDTWGADGFDELGRPAASQVYNPTPSSVAW